MIKSVIIEDVHHAAEHLELLLQQSRHSVEVIARLDSVKKAVEWLKDNTADLIFLDIQLRNDLCFDIFDHVQVTTPVIFTTSYDQYIVKSFELNNLAYLLKPIEEDDLHAALDKYRLLYDTTQNINEKILPLHAGYQKRFMVQSGKAVKSIPAESVAYIRVQKNYVVLTTKDARQYVLGTTLDTLEQRLNTEMFFRINRQFIISIDAIDDMFVHTKGRLKITTTPPCKEDLLVGVEKAPDFKNWLNR